MTKQPGVSDRMMAMFLIFCLVLAAWQVWRLPTAWHDWRAGVPDRYPGEHRDAALGAISGLAGAVLIPVPLAIMRTLPHQRGQRALLWGMWVALMSIVIWTLVARSGD